VAAETMKPELWLETQIPNLEIGSMKLEPLARNLRAYHLEAGTCDRPSYKARTLTAAIVKPET